MRYRYFVGLLLGLCIAANASWAQREPGWSTLEQQFTQMPMEARRLTGPLFWLHGDDNETKERLEFYLDKVAEGHNGSFCTESRPHSDWLGPRWYSDLDICLQQAKKRNLKMWIFDERWWPSQTVAGKVPDRYAAKQLAAEAEQVTGPRALTTAITGNIVAVIAGKPAADGIDPSSLVDLTPSIRNGALTWDVPAGDWRIMKFTWITAPRARQGSQATVDGASRDCVDWFLQTVYQPHYDRFKDDFGKTIVGFFYDEPETQGDWGTELDKTFAERGVDWRKALVAWKFGLTGGEQAAAKYAYVDALGETWGRTMYGSTLKWCEDRGVDFIGHFIEHDGWYLRPGHGALNLFQMQKYNSMGGMDLVCQQLWPGERRHGIYQLPKLNSSISHAYGKKDDLAMTEIFGAYGQGITYPQMKWLCDWHQVRGTNFMITHSFNPKAPNDTDCPPYFYNGGEEPRWPLYRVWADYTNRLSLMLTGGRHVCPIAFLFCGNSAYVGKAVTPENMTGVIQDARYDCDWLPYEVFEDDMRISARELSLRDERYQVLIVPPVEAIPYETLAKAKQFFDAGGIVVAYDFLPTQSASLGRTSADITALANAIWGESQSGLKVCRTNAAGGRSYFLPGKVNPQEFAQVLAKDAGVPPVVEVTEGNTDNWLHVLHRVKSGRDICLICNQQHEGPAKQFRLRLRAKGEPECWDPLRNEITAIPWASDKTGLVEVKLTLEPMESVLIVFGPGKSTRPARLDSSSKPAQTIPLAREKTSAAHTTTLDLRGCSWVWYPEGNPVENAPPGTRWFRKEITIPNGSKINGAGFLITADNEFALFVNGKQVAKTSGDNAWRKPKNLDITKYLTPGKNVLAIAATNTTDKPSPAGLIGRYVINFAQGAPVTGSIDRSWKTSDRETPGWEMPSFDDGKWASAKETAAFGEGPWQNIAGSILPADPFTARCALPKGIDLKNSRIYLEMDDLHEGASIKVNGAYAGGIIGKPYRLDVTRHLRAGANTIEIEPYAPRSARLSVYR